MFMLLEGVSVTIGNLVFCLALYLTAVHAQGKLQHVSYFSEQKFQCRPISTNQNSTNRWCQIVRGNVCLCVCVCVYIYILYIYIIYIYIYIYIYMID